LGKTRSDGDELNMKKNSHTVLIIEDDHDVAELVACFLARADFRAVIASNGTDGLWQAHALQPSLILCDSCLPGLDGVEVIEALRRDASTAQIPVVLMSGYDAARFDGSDVSAFLQKPFQMADMVALVRSCLTEQAALMMDGHDRSAFECAVPREPIRV
jgi:DNA-binding response OmpR family regulator